jgi:hypothetical protein
VKPANLRTIWADRSIALSARTEAAFGPRLCRRFNGRWRQVFIEIRRFRWRSIRQRASELKPLRTLGGASGTMKSEWTAQLRLVVVPCFLLFRHLP